MSFVLFLSVTRYAAKIMTFSLLLADKQNGIYVNSCITMQYCLKSKVEMVKRPCSLFKCEKPVPDHGTPQVFSDVLYS